MSSKAITKHIRISDYYNERDKSIRPDIFIREIVQLLKPLKRKNQITLFFDFVNIELEDMFLPILINYLKQKQKFIFHSFVTIRMSNDINQLLFFFNVSEKGLKLLEQTFKRENYGE